MLKAGLYPFKVITGSDITGSDEIHVNVSHFDIMTYACLLDRTYEEAVRDREQGREQYRRAQRRGGRRTRFVFPIELQQLPCFADWVEEEVRRQQQSGEIVNSNILDTSRGPLPVAAAYKSMYAFGNHYRVLSSERPLRTRDSGVAATFRQVCRNGTRDGNQVNADVEYVGHIEEILELNYRRHCLVVLVCDFVKANYIGENATVKKDKWGFTLANYDRRFGRVCRDSFSFPRHCEQVFYSDAREAPGWRIVLRKEVRGRRILPNNENIEEPALFQMGRDEEFEGLRPDRDVGEGGLQPATTGENVLLDHVRLPNRGGRGGRGRGGRPGRQGGRAGRIAEGQEEGISTSEEVEGDEDGGIDRQNMNNVIRGIRRRRGGHEDRMNRNVMPRHQSESDLRSSSTTSLEEETSVFQNSSTETGRSSSESNERDEVMFLQVLSCNLYCLYTTYITRKILRVTVEIPLGNGAIFN